MGILFGEPFIFPLPFLSCHSPWMVVKGVVGGMGLICTRDHVFFVTVAQLLPCLQDMNLADWSMVVFWNESAGSGSKKGPDIGLDFTDQPASSPHVLLVVTEMKTWICRTIRMKMVDIRQEAVRRDRDLAMGRLRTSQPFRWSTMKSRLLLVNSQKCFILALFCADSSR